MLGKKARLRRRQDADHGHEHARAFLRELVPRRLLRQRPRRACRRATSFETAKYFVLGSGDVGSVLDSINIIRSKPTGRSAAGVRHDDGHALDRNAGHRLSSAPGTTRAASTRSTTCATRAPSAARSCRARTACGSQGEGRPLGAFVDFDIMAGQTTPVRTESTPPGARREHRRRRRAPAPREVDRGWHVRARHAAPASRGTSSSISRPDERFRAERPGRRRSDDPETRRYIEAFGFTQDGHRRARVRPGTYRIVSSRGPEYDLASTDDHRRPERDALDHAQAHARRRHHGLHRRRPARPQQEQHRLAR